MESGAALRASRSSAFLSIKYWSTGAIFGYLSDCAAAFGTSEPMLISSTRIVQPQAMMLIIFSLIILSVITLALAILAFIFLSPWPPSSRGILSPSPLLTLLYDFAQIRNRPYLNRSILH